MTFFQTLRTYALCTGGLLAVSLTSSSLLAAPPRVPANRSATAIPYSQPETKALDAELLRLSTQTKTDAKQIKDLQSDVWAVRKDVQRAILVTTAIRKMDERLDDLIDRLEVYRSVPNVRTAVKVLVANLQKLKGSIQTLRKKSDPVEKSTLRPLAKKLKSFERSLNAPMAKLNQLAISVDRARVNLLNASKLAQRQSSAVVTLERSSRLVRPTAATLANTVAKFNTEVYAVRKDIYTVRKGFATFWTVEQSLTTLNRAIAPGDKVAGDLDRVLSKRISIKIPLKKKTVSFTVRQILETPGKVLDIVLKPLEALAKKALSPVLKKLNVRIPPPKGLAEMSRSLDSLGKNGTSLDKSMASLDSASQKQLDPQADALSRLLVTQKLN